MIILFVLLGIIALIMIFAAVLLFATFTYEIKYTNGALFISIGGIHNRVTVYRSAKKPEDEKPKKDSIKVPTFHGLDKKASAVKDIYKHEKNEITDIVKSIFSKVLLKNIDLSVTIGTGDAAITGFVCGAVWSVYSTVFKALNKRLDIEKITNFALSPKYNEKIFEYKFRLVFSTKLWWFLSDFKRIRRFLKRNKREIEILNYKSHAVRKGDKND